jgi:hypothetical protein
VIWSTLSLDLQSHFCDHCECSRLTRLLDRLGESKYGHHLAACILIDINTGLVSKKVFARVFDLFDLAAVDPIKEFGLAIERMEAIDRDSAWPKRTHKLDHHEPRSYARVMEIGTFVRHCLAPGKFNLMNEASLKGIRLTYFGGGKEGRPLARLTRMFTGTRGRVWVLPLEDLKTIRDQHGDDTATAARDALGLPIRNGVGPEGRAEFVAVIYPESATLESAQPSTLDATWTSTPCYFLAAKGSTGWGRTHNCAGSGLTCRERVHGPLEGLDRAYRGVGLGVAKDLDIGLWSRILLEAERRLKAVSCESDKSDE